MHAFLIHHKAAFQVVGANLVAIGISLQGINEILTTISLTLAIAYTIYKFFDKKP